MTRGMRGRTAAALAALVGLLGALLAVGISPSADARASGLVYGAIKFPHRDSPKITVLYFTTDWGYLGSANTEGGSYSIDLDPGTYRLQFVDQRPAYITTKYAPTDIKVTVRADDPDGTRKDVKMDRGAFITGSLKANGRPAGKSKVVAALACPAECPSFATTTNKKGQFAVGGLPAGRYSVFSYDRHHFWVDKSAWAGALGPGQSSNLAINLRKKAGTLRVYLFTNASGTKNRVSGHPVVTAVSKKTGQFWSVKSKGGSAVFQGLYPGRYKLVANGFGNWFAKTAAVQGGKVRPGRTAFGTFTYTKRGGWMTGTVVDSSNQSIALDDAVVVLYNSDGVKLDETTSAANGNFTLDGQLATQSGLTVVVQPGPYTDYLGTSSQRCEYQATSHEEQSVTAGRETDLGPVGIDRLEGGTCNAP